MKHNFCIYVNEKNKQGKRAIIIVCKLIQTMVTFTFAIEKRQICEIDTYNIQVLGIGKGRHILLLVVRKSFEHKRTLYAAPRLKM